AIVWLLFHVARCCTVGFKYALAAPSFLEHQYTSNLKENYKLLEQSLFILGWSDPKYYDVLRREFDEAMAYLDTDLRQIKICFDSPAIAQGFNGEFPMRGQPVIDDTDTNVSALKFCWHTVMLSFGKQQSTLAQIFAGCVSLTLLCAGPFARYLLGIPLLGDTWQAAVCCICLFIGPLVPLIAVTSFAGVTLLSYNRRARAMQILDHLITDGLDMNECFPSLPKDQKDLYNVHRMAPTDQLSQSCVKIDLTDGNNVMALTLSRRILRQVGRRYHSRINQFTILLFVISIMSSAALNFFFIFDPDLFQHSLAADLTLAIFTLYGGSCIALTTWFASQCNDPARYRQRLQRQLLMMSLEMWDLAGTMHENGPSESMKANRMKALRDMLQQADFICGYEEEVSDPVMVLGLPAHYGAILSSVSIIISAMFSAAEGALRQFSQNDATYNEDGLFQPGY
ncbi:hypothetical protein CYMTET_21355, partial [Cymbomonas tetramitiformis]